MKPHQVAAHRRVFDDRRLECRHGRAFDQFADILEFVLLFYVPIYLYRAMRRVYGQGRLWTFTKFAVLNIAYIICIVLTGLGLLFYTALTL